MSEARVQAQYKQLAVELARELQDATEALHQCVRPELTLRNCDALNCRRRQKLLRRRDVQALLKEKT